jgi:hypothetical protein
MSLYSLDKELTYRILSFILHPEGYRVVTPWGGFVKENARLACISRTWQAVVEGLTFHTLTLTEHDLADAARIITPARQRLVRQMHFNIQLDSYEEEARWRVESAAEQERNNEVFTAAVRNIFNTVRDWDPEPYHSGQKLSLSIEVWSPTDIDRLSAEAAEELVQRLPFSPLRRYEASLIRFLDSADTLPTLEHVTELTIQRLPPDPGRGRNLYRAVDPATASLLVSKCPNLDSLSLHLMDWPRAATEERKRRRKTLAAAIDNLPKDLCTLHLAYRGSAPRDENCDPPNLLDPGETEDALSLSLRRFYRRRTTTHVFISNTILGQEFFIPEGGADEERNEQAVEDDGSEEWWYDHGEPSEELNDLIVHWAKVTPDGRWLFQRHEGKNAEQVVFDEFDDASNSKETEEGDGEEPAAGPTDPNPELDDPAYTRKHRFRIVPVRELMNPLLKAMARTMSKLPLLSTFEWSVSSDYPAHRVQYCPTYGEGGGDLGFYGFGIYEDGEDLIDTGEPLVDEDVVEYFTELLSAREPKGEVEVTIE